MSRAIWMLVVVGVAVSLLYVGCGDGEEAGSGNHASSSDYSAEAAHIHGLGVNPADGALFIATHSGVFRAPEGSRDPVRVGDGTQDTMGFTVAGPDRFFGSGHPGPNEAGPPHLGLIESRDAGRNWRNVSLAGRADFHVLRFARGRIYAYNGLNGALMISENGGDSWDAQEVPAPLIDLAVDPGDPERVVVSSETGLMELARVPRGEETLSNRIGLLAWPRRSSLYLAGADGGISVSADGGRSWLRRGRLPEAPVALLALSPSELYAAMRSGTILHSVDGGRRWTPRIQP
ncbi:MAG TPA: hypothetical protein VFZ41_10935 [Solirubrobacterales bacterium]